MLTLLSCVDTVVALIKVNPFLVMNGLSCFFNTPEARWHVEFRQSGILQ